MMKNPKLTSGRPRDIIFVKFDKNRNLQKIVTLYTPGKCFSKEKCKNNRN